MEGVLVLHNTMYYRESIIHMILPYDTTAIMLGPGQPMLGETNNFRLLVGKITCRFPSLQLVHDAFVS
jgi:hypothetical protein